MAGDADLWVPVADVGAPKLVLYSRRLANGDEGALTIITLVDLTEPAQPSGETLQRLFGLTAAEARLACEIACGASPSEAAAALGIEMLIARSQLSSILAKTGTQRQGALVALLARLAVLPTALST
jgi:DNA-binding CsgD family transcriptional regulator